MKRFLAVFLSFAIACGVAGCASTGTSTLNSTPESETNSRSFDEIKDIVSDKNFTADPQDYPLDIYGLQLTTGEFGNFIKAFNEKNKEFGEQAIAFLGTDTDGEPTIQVHYSPKDVMLEIKSYKIVAQEYLNFAKLIIQLYPTAIDNSGNYASVVLGRQGAVIVASYSNGVPLYTKLTATTGIDDLDEALKKEYMADEFFSTRDLDNYK